jgi:hypothetical protein
LQAAKWLGAGWRRKGRGLTRQFYATDDDVERWLLECTPSDVGPFTILTGGVQDSHAGADANTVVELPVDKFRGAVERLGFWDWFLRSASLTPALPMNGIDLEGEWLRNGLINIQHGRRVGGRRTASSIGFVNRVIEETTGAEITHEAYRRVYRALEHCIQRDAIVPTLVRFTDGSSEIDSVVKMTPGAVAQGQQGELFDVDAALD